MTGEDEKVGGELGEVREIVERDRYITSRERGTLKEARMVVQRMEEDQNWDSIMARDLDPRLTSYCGRQLELGIRPDAIQKSLGMTGKQWKKIQAFLRMGFRADAETYIYRQTARFYKTLARAEKILNDAIDNGTPHVITHEPKGQPSWTEIIKVKGATKELSGFLKTYADCIHLPVKLWKDLGAIGEKANQVPQGVSILVQNLIPMPTAEEILAKQKELMEKVNAIEIQKVEVKPKKEPADG